MIEPKYEILKNGIKEKIRAGIWKEGDKIPAQRVLEELFDVSRITVKKAVSDLINENYLEHLPGKKSLYIKKQKENIGSKIIAVAIDCVTDLFGRTILRGIEDYLWKKRYHTIICNADRDFSKVEEYFHSFDYGKVDGIIFAPVIDKGYQERNGSILMMLKDKKIPYVLVDRYVPGIQSNYVISDDMESARLLTRSLIKSGHKRILIGKGLDCSSMDERTRGVRQAFAEMNLKFDERLLIQVNDNQLSPEINLRELQNMENQIEHSGGFSAFYAQNDRILNAGIKSMSELNVNIDSIQLALHNEVSKPMPPYTDHIPHIVPPLYKIGWNAAKILLENIEEGADTINHVIIKNELIFDNLIHAGKSE
jgi:DNA-binding LacI/PurR family transcriptional regulator